MIESGLDVVGLHPVGGKTAHLSLDAFLEQTKTEAYQRFCRRMRQNGIQVTLECHALSWLVPRELYAQHPDWFRMDENGQRVADFNICASNEEALAFLEERTAELAAQVPADDHMYRLWIDDTMGTICSCEKCRHLSGADQAMILYNRMLRGIKGVDPKGKLAYLAYHNTLQVPTVKPEEGIFLEFAPIHRLFDYPINDPNCQRNQAEIANVEALLDYFGREDAQLLEYWMDNSLFCHWQLPYKKLELNEEVMRCDMRYYRSLGFEYYSSFGCFLGEDYAREFGPPPVRTYRDILQNVR